MIIGPIRFRGRYGYLDEAGRVRVPFVFEGLGSFSQGLAWFLRNNKVGFINECNEEVIPPTFDRGRRLIITSDFHSGLAAVCLGSHEGYVDRKGEMQIPFRYGSCSRFVGEIAIVCSKSSEFSIINQEGEILSDLPFHDVAESPYETDIVKVYPRLNGVVAPTFVNRYGKVIAGPFHELEEIYSFSPGFPFYAAAHSRLTGLVGFLGRDWSDAIPFKFKGAKDFSQGIAAACSQEYLWGYIDPAGDWVIEPEYTDAHSFHGGTASVRLGRGRVEKWLVINRQNQQISPTFYEGIWDFENGYRLVSVGKSVMLIDPGCNVIWSAEET